MDRVAVVGAGLTRFGRRVDVGMNHMAWEAIKAALEDAGIEQKDVDFFAVGNTGVWSEEPLPAITVGEYAGLTPKGTMRVEAACATGSAAIRVAYQAIASGSARVALAVGVEKMYNSPTGAVVELIGRAGNYFWEFENFGLTFPGYYALYASAYMAKYEVKEEDLALVSVKNHYYGSFNPYAQFQKPVKLEDVMSSKYVAYPLKLLDSSPITDGAAAVVLADEESARKLTDTPVWIKSQGVASGSANLSKRQDFLGLPASVEAAAQAYRGAGITDPLKQIDVATVHDCFTIAEILAYEDLGFAKRGEGVQLIRDQQTYKDGIIPVNLDGGLKAKGHPIGATGAGMAVEAVKQLRGEAPPQRQATIRNGVALTHNVGGTGHYAYVTVYSL
ncbi:acetyl-CoA acetyltransferase [Candidatus Marsarchaeota G2 archaeon ECH_B_2]|uniref:Acetyl-CoA acetyltransferase n=3 Tax=Candidatus Marsarchaeota group 2 TaxID=2203771 RepID=A0A2R6B839_9ARCH|nr:MAG: acetyl-CoA acetyltransferase [Candidatus Marsarchaeota G2 archaeon ECH_B_2]PSN99271.1 MAG: acetyl-CoA acetyltransferase [Candidatus Marsarchaeota G2 archaeon ECH_B_3]PSO01546.1 MAG: acetyl-CoA acetyltransferase [Candidatus Marsarchaeota G2 archaeon ECH_B_1]